MIQLVLIVVPCALVGTAAILLVQRLGLLPKLDPHTARLVTRTPQRRKQGSARPVAVATIAILSAWIVLWIVLLVIGLTVVSAAS